MARYRNRISGPLLDRIDLFVQVPVETKQTAQLWQQPCADTTTEPKIQVRILQARQFGDTTRRQRKTNSRLDPRETREFVELDGPAEQLMLDASRKWSLSARAVHRTLRVARTICDLAGTETVLADAIAEALSYRHETLKQSSQS